jgi:hypothetical protein
MKATNLKDNQRVTIQHGELCLRPVNTMPTGKTINYTHYIAAHSESGHHHVIESKHGIEVLEQNNERYILIKEVSKLFHQKTFDIHETQYLAPGVYQVTHKIEYDPWQKVVRAVFD